MILTLIEISALGVPRRRAVCHVLPRHPGHAELRAAERRSESYYRISCQTCHGLSTVIKQLVKSVELYYITCLLHYNISIIRGGQITGILSQMKEDFEKDHIRL